MNYLVDLLRQSLSSSKVSQLLWYIMQSLSLFRPTVAPIPSREEYEDDTTYNDACNLWNGFVAIGDKFDSAENRLDYIVVADALQDLIVQRTKGYPTQTLSDPFPLYHPDLSANNIYVDDDFNITSIIDWSFCSSVPFTVLLAPPGLPQSRNALTEDLIKVFREAYKEASRTDCYTKGNTESQALLPSDPTLPSDAIVSSNTIAILDDGDFSWSLIRLLTFNSTNDIRIFRTIWNTVHNLDLETFITSQRHLPHYMQLYEEVHAEDKPMSEIRKTEKDYFRNTTDFTVARNLTVVSNWGFRHKAQLNRFQNANMSIANSKLWAWVLEAKAQRDQ